MQANSSSSNSKIGNQLLDALSPAAQERLRPHLIPWQMTIGQEIHRAGETAEYVHFPTSGLISVIASMSDGASVEIGMAGREGMFSVGALLGDDRPLQRAIAQLPGTALRLQIRRFRHEMEADAAMRKLLFRYAQGTLSAVAQSAACNRLHMLEERCARWLLMAHDRADGDRFPITHEFLAMMLGVRRPGVTIAAQSLQEAGLIVYNHGSMSIVDRKGLEAIACECYRSIRDEFDRLMAV